MDHSQPHPWPIETFLGSHPRALKFVQDPKPMPVSFVTETFYSNNSFVFVNRDGERRVGRYKFSHGQGHSITNQASKGTSESEYLAYMRSRLSATS